MESSNPVAAKPLYVRIPLILLIVCSATLILNSIFEFLPFTAEASAYWTTFGYLGLFLGNCYLLWVIWQDKKRGNAALR